MSPSRGTKGFPRLAHKKSRSGCKRCRQRRVKCDEVHPICGGCNRHQVTCEYDHGTPSIRSSPRSRDDNPFTAHAIPTSNSSGVVPISTEDEPPESKSRRTMELRMLYHYMSKTCVTFLRESGSGSNDIPITESWAYRSIDLAFRHETILYAIISLSALHVAKTSDSDLDAMDIHRTYLDMTLRAHQKQLNNITKETADATCMASSMIRTTGLAMLSSRTLETEDGRYDPPMQWLQMTGGSGRVYWAAWEYIREDPNSIAMQLLNREPFLSPFNEKLFLESNRQSLLPLLARTPEDELNETWNETIFNAYAQTLSYIGSIVIALRGGKEKSLEIGRRLIVFPMLIDKLFITLVRERQQRAIVILAFYFSMLSLYRDVWFFAEAGEQEVTGIMTILSDRWRPLTKWPLKVMSDATVNIPEPFF